MNLYKKSVAETNVNKSILVFRNLYFGLILLYIFHLNNFMMAADVDAIESNEEEKIEQLKNKILSYKNSLLNACINMQEHELVSFIEELCKKAMSVQCLKTLRSIYNIIVDWSAVFIIREPSIFHSLIRLDMIKFIYLNDESTKTQFDFSQIGIIERLEMILFTFNSIRDELDIHINEIIDNIKTKKNKLLSSYDELYKGCFEYIRKLYENLIKNPNDIEKIMIIYETKRDLENKKNALLSLKIELRIEIEKYIINLIGINLKFREDYERCDKLNYTRYIKLFSPSFKEYYLLATYKQYLKIQIYNHAYDSLCSLLFSETFFEIVTKEEIDEIEDKNALFIGEVDSILTKIEQELECRRKADDKFYKGKRMKSTLIPLLF